MLTPAVRYPVAHRRRRHRQGPTVHQPRLDHERCQAARHHVFTSWRTRREDCLEAASLGTRTPPTSAHPAIGGAGRPPA
jgi:hypothetical protein